MKFYPSYDALALDLDLHFFDKISILRQTGRCLEDGKWFVITGDGQCYLFDKDGNLDDINKITIFEEYFIRKDIKKIVIPNSVMNIGPYSFFYCSGLKNVTIPNTVTSIENYAFYDCNSLTSVMIGCSMMSIGWSTFYCCKNLKNVFFKGKTLKQVKVMHNYPWGIEDIDIIKAEFN